MKATLRFHPAGHVTCLYSDAIELQQLGRLHVVRATDIRFDAQKQQWIVQCATTGRLLHSDPSRERCLTWERDNLAPPGFQPSVSP